MSLRTRLNSWPKRRRKIIYALAAMLLLLAIVLFIVKTLSSPAVGSISQSPPSSRALSNFSKITPGKYDGKYISFTYPPNFKKVPSKLTGSYLEVIDLYDTDHTSKQISIGVRKQSLADESGISFRQKNPETYKLERRTINSYIFVSRSGGFERAAFISRGELLVNIVATAPSGQDMTDDSEQLITTLNWK